MLIWFSETAFGWDFILWRVLENAWDVFLLGYIIVVLGGFCPKPVTHQNLLNRFPTPIRTKNMTDWLEGFLGAWLNGAENCKWHVQIHSIRKLCQSNEAFRGVASQQQERCLTFRMLVAPFHGIHREMQVVQANLHLRRFAVPTKLFQQELVADAYHGVGAKLFVAHTEISWKSSSGL